jgi:hypothetical protein
MQTSTTTHRPNPRAAAEWLAVMHATDAIELASLRRRLVSGGDVQTEFRRNYEAHMREHDEAMIAMLRTSCSHHEGHRDGQ